jgi:hypothetical protein
MGHFALLLLNKLPFIDIFLLFVGLRDIYKLEFGAWQSVPVPQQILILRMKEV